MPTANRIKNQINERIRRLVEIGLADRHHIGFFRRAGRMVEITFPNAAHVSLSLKNIEYAETYLGLVRNGAYNEV